MERLRPPFQSLTGESAASTQFVRGAYIKEVIEAERVSRSGKPGSSRGSFCEPECVSLSAGRWVFGVEQRLWQLTPQPCRDPHANHNCTQINALTTTHCSCSLVYLCGSLCSFILCAALHCSGLDSSLLPTASHSPTAPFLLAALPLSFPPHQPLRCSGFDRSESAGSRSPA